MKTFLIDYYDLNTNGEREYDYCSTLEIEAPNHEDAGKLLYEERGDVEISSIWSEEKL